MTETLKELPELDLIAIAKEIQQLDDAIRAYAGVGYNDGGTVYLYQRMSFLTKQLSERGLVCQNGVIETEKAVGERADKWTRNLALAFEYSESDDPEKRRKAYHFLRGGWPIET